MPKRIILFFLGHIHRGNHTDTENPSKKNSKQSLQEPNSKSLH